MSNIFGYPDNNDSPEVWENVRLIEENERLKRENSVIIATGKMEYKTVSKDDIIGWLKKENTELRDKLAQYEINETFDDLNIKEIQELRYKINMLVEQNQKLRKELHKQ